MMQLLVKRTRKTYDKSSNMKMAIVIVDDNSNTIAHTLIEKKKKMAKIFN